MHFRLLIIILGYLASYFLAMSMPIRQVGTLAQTRMRIGSVTFPDMGSMRGQCHNFVNTHTFFFLILVINFVIQNPVFLK